MLNHRPTPERDRMSDRSTWRAGGMGRTDQVMCGYLQIIALVNLVSSHHLETTSNVLISLVTRLGRRESLKKGRFL